MKRFSLLPLVALVFAVACTDSTAPANSRALINPGNPALDRLGDPPPPPVDAGIIITVSSHIVLVAPFEGVYFSNGTTAWLRLNNSQSDAFETAASGNARFMRTDNKMSGNGTLEINGHTITIEEVTLFTANPECTTTGEPCATIEFDATVDGEPNHHGTANAFNREDCTFVPPDGENEGFFFCGGEEIG